MHYNRFWFPLTTCAVLLCFATNEYNLISQSLAWEKQQKEQMNLSIKRIEGKISRYVWFGCVPAVIRLGKFQKNLIKTSNYVK